MKAATRMMKRLPHMGQRGFTLLELMIAMAILAVLMSIVAPRLSGSRGVSVDSQIKSDAQNVQTAINNFNNKANRSNTWPDQALGTTYAYSATTGSKTLATGDKVVLASKGAAIAPDATAYVELNWATNASIWLSDGSVADAIFLPDFITKMPDSATLQNDEGITDSTGAKLREVLWLLKKSQVGTENESRTLEVYRLNSYDSSSRTIVYERLF